jgi:hypothetical protein
MDYQSLYEQEKTMRIVAEQRAEAAEAKLTRVKDLLPSLLEGLDAIQSSADEIKAKISEAKNLPPS